MNTYWTNTFERLEAALADVQQRGDGGAWEVLESEVRAAHRAINENTDGALGWVRNSRAAFEMAVDAAERRDLSATERAVATAKVCVV